LLRQVLPQQDMIKEKGSRLHREALRGSASEPQLFTNTAPGRMQRNAIPGYTGFVSGMNSENVFSSVHKEANSLTATIISRRGCDDVASERGRQWQGDRILARSIDDGAMSSTLGTSGRPGPSAKASSCFYNPRGHTCLRSGSAVPGYAGHIPGRVAGAVFGARYSQDNLAATGVRRREGADHTTNWLLASEFDKRAKDCGAHTALGNTIRSIGFHESGRLEPQMRMPEAMRYSRHADKGAWRLYEPNATHEKLRY